MAEHAAKQSTPVAATAPSSAAASQPRSNASHDQSQLSALDASKVSAASLNWALLDAAPVADQQVMMDHLQTQDDCGMYLTSQRAQVTLPPTAQLDQMQNAHISALLYANLPLDLQHISQL